MAQDLGYSTRGSVRVLSKFSASGFAIYGLGCRVWSLLGVQGFPSWVQGVGLRVWSCETEQCSLLILASEGASLLVFRKPQALNLESGLPQS